MKRLQRSRARGWRMPADAVYVGRPSPWGNPFPISGDVAPWLAVALGQRADAAGRRTAAVMAYRAWMTATPLPIPAASPDGAALEYSDGSVLAVKDIVVGMGLLMLSKSPISIPDKPDLEPLRGHDLVCWCPPGPCHADVLLDLLR